MDKWQPIDTAPKDGTEILAARSWAVNTGGQLRWCYFVCFWNRLGWDDGSDTCFAYPTHWMPLPEAPHG